MEWIPVTDKLPKDQQSVLVYNGHGAVMSRYREVKNPASPRFGGIGEFEVEKYPDKYDRVSSSYWAEVTHWMALPESPVFISTSEQSIKSKTV